MFKVYCASRIILKSSIINSFQSLSRKLSHQTEKKSSIFENIINFWKPTEKSVLNLKVVPEGYKLVYFNKSLGYLNAGHVVLACLCVTAAFNFSGYFLDPEWLDHKTPFWDGQCNPWLGLVILFYIVSIYFGLSRCVRLIYRKDEQYKCVCYGLFGNFRKIIIDSKIHECEGPKTQIDFFHYINNKRLFIFKEFFFYEKDYYEMLK